MRRKNSPFNFGLPVGVADDPRHETVPQDGDGASATGLRGCRKAPFQEEPTLGVSGGCLSASMHSAAAFVLPAFHDSISFANPLSAPSPGYRTAENRAGITGEAVGICSYFLGFWG
jgi:hypothetical protein